MEEISKRLFELAKYYRVERAADFAKKTGLPHQTSSNYLKGDRVPTIDALLKIQQAFEGLNLDWLLNGKEPMLQGEEKAVKEIILDTRDIKDLEIEYLKNSLTDKDEVIQSQKALILVLSEKAGIDLSEITDEQNTIEKKGKSIIKGFGAFYPEYFKMIVRNIQFQYQ